MVKAEREPRRNENRRRQWVARVEALIAQIEKWAEAEDWAVARQTKTIHERLIGDYSVPVLRVRLPGGEVHVNPVGLHVIGADGRVDLEAFPTLNRIKLIGANKSWQIITDSNVPLRQPWNSKTFVQLAHDLLA